MHALRWECTLLGECPLLLLAQGVPFPPSRAYCVLVMQADVWGGPPLLWDRPACCGGARPVPHLLLPTRGFCVLLGLGIPLCVLGLVARGVPRCCVHPPPSCAPAARRGRMLLSRGSLFPFLPSAAPHIKRAQLFEGGPRLVLSSVRFLRRECALWDFAPLLLRPYSLQVPQDPMAILSAGGPSVGMTSLHCL